MEAALGLACLDTLPQAFAPEELSPVAPTAVLVQYFLMAFAQSFPAAAELLFPGMAAPGGILSPSAAMMIERICVSLPGGEADAFAAAMDNLLMAFGEIYQNESEVPMQ